MGMQLLIACDVSLGHLLFACTELHALCLAVWNQCCEYWNDLWPLNTYFRQQSFWNPSVICWMLTEHYGCDPPTYSAMVLWHWECLWSTHKSAPKTSVDLKHERLDACSLGATLYVGVILFGSTFGKQSTKATKYQHGGAGVQDHSSIPFMQFVVRD